MWLTLIDDAVTELRRHDLRRYAVEGVNGRRKAGTFMAGPLSGLRVVELAGIGPGPHAAMILGTSVPTWCASIARQVSTVFRETPCCVTGVS